MWQCSFSFVRYFRYEGGSRGSQEKARRKERRKRRKEERRVSRRKTVREMETMLPRRGKKLNVSVDRSRQTRSDTRCDVVVVAVIVSGRGERCILNVKVLCVAVKA
jgi:hypothetical protein